MSTIHAGHGVAKRKRRPHQPALSPWLVFPDPWRNEDGDTYSAAHKIGFLSFRLGHQPGTEQLAYARFPRHRHERDVSVLSYPRSRHFSGQVPRHGVKAVFAHASALLQRQASSKTVSSDSLLPAPIGQTHLTMSMKKMSSERGAVETAPLSKLKPLMSREIPFHTMLHMCKPGPPRYLVTRPGAFLTDSPGVAKMPDDKFAELQDDPSD